MSMRSGVANALRLFGPVLLLVSFLFVMGYCASMFKNPQKAEAIGTPLFFWIFLLLGLGLTGLILLLLSTSFKYELEKLRFEFSYLGGNHLVPILLGFGMSSVLVAIGIAIFKGESNPVNEKIFEILGIYVTTTATFVLLRAFFDKVAPSTTVEELLKKLIVDLKKHKNKDCNAWIVFPALNIGGFRKARFYQDYKDALSEFAYSERTSLRMVTYEKELYKKMFTCYDVMYDGKKDTQTIDEVTKDAAGLYDAYVTTYSGHSKNQIRGIKPPEFPPHVIVIGDIVYFINTLGLPIYRLNNDGTEDFVSPFDTTNLKRDIDNLVKLIVYRYQDEYLAESVTKRLERVLNIPQSPTES